MTKKIPGTTYALVGLLALRPWTTYELARQSDRSLRWFFSRAERGVYQEAKRLVALGWATAATTWAGGRRATTYHITPAGQAAFETWLEQRPAPLQIESEGLVRAFLAGPQHLGAVRANVEAIGEDARDALHELGILAREWLSGEAPFRERGPTNALTVRLVADVHRAIAEWSEWAIQGLEQIEAGPGPAVALADEVYAHIAEIP